MSNIAALVADNLDIWTSAVERKSSSGRGSSKKVSLYGIDRLRELILNLAIRGKLVPQCKNDQPAAELLKLLPDEWPGVRRRKPKSEKSTVEQVEFELPRNWVAAPGTRIFGTRSGNSKLIKGKLHPEFGEGLYPGFSASGQDVWLNDFEHEGVAIILSAVGARCGKAFLAQGQWSAIANTHIVWMEPRVTLPDFAMLVLNNEQYWERAGGAQPFVKVGNTLAKPFFVPPMAEQKRIVAKVDELMSLCDALEQESEEALAAHQTLVETLLATLTTSTDAADLAKNWARLEKHFDTLFTTEASVDALKQAILDIAVRGRLVEQSKDEEPASTHLALAPSKNDRAPAGYPDLPGGWACRPLGQIIGGMDSGWSPACHPFPAQSEDKWGVLKTTAVQELEYLQEENKELPEKLEPRESAEACAGDILITRAGPTNRVGICCYVPETRSKLMISDKIIRFRPASKDMSGQFLALALSAGPAAQHLEGAKSGMASSQVNISQTKLKNTWVMLPPPAEQRRIIAKVDELLAVCDALKSRLSEAVETQRHLADAIVERAAA